MSISFRVGDMTIHRLIEMTLAERHATEFLPNLTWERLEANRSWLQPAALNEQDWIVLCFQSYVVVTPHHAILVDSCLGNNKERLRHPYWHHKTDTVFMDALSGVGLRVEDIDYVLCTHLHVDHVGWNTRLENGRWKPTFPNARYMFSSKEMAVWTPESGVEPPPHIQDSVLPIVAAGKADMVASDHEISEHVRLMPTPGHTIDHFAVQLGRGGDQAVITGDLIHSPLQARFPDLHMLLDLDKQKAVQTRRRFLERYCDSGTICCFSHFPSPSMGAVRRWGDGFRCDFIE
ncbi:MBL fold metallo-hydrolase [Methylocapsa sp. S129]|uniref:MBL fold metallo-hydrolase n=1 Tax=Methylocapsa sp. S129 TaxID=1641869 RepID=UPI001576A5CF|nr:MBL fold metallo-hydrolase [Methylocapsa sp. S129]